MKFSCYRQRVILEMRRKQRSVGVVSIGHDLEPQPGIACLIRGDVGGNSLIDAVDLAFEPYDTWCSYVTRVRNLQEMYA